MQELWERFVGFTWGDSGALVFAQSKVQCERWGQVHLGDCSVCFGRKERGHFQEAVLRFYDELDTGGQKGVGR